MKILVESIEKATAKTGAEYIKVNCISEEKEKKLLYLWESNLWNSVSNFEKLFNAGVRIFDCEISADVNFPKIMSFTESTGTPLEFYSFIYPDDDYASQVLTSLISSIKSTFYKSLIDQVMDLPGTNEYRTIKETFMVIPAAKAYHHDFRYGLLRHTHEVMSFVSRVSTSELFKESLDVDLLLTGALLHDIGKCHEYKFDGNNSAEYGTSTEINQIYLGSHLYKGAEMIALAYEKLKLMFNEYDTEINDLRVEHLKHVVLSHHLQREWAAVPKAPQTLEAFLVFLGDYFSAAFGKFNVIDWSEVSPENLFGSTSKFDTFFGFTPLIKKLENSD